MIVQYILGLFDIFLEDREFLEPGQERGREWVGGESLMESLGGDVPGLVGVRMGSGEGWEGTLGEQDRRGSRKREKVEV